MTVPRCGCWYGAEQGFPCVHEKAHMDDVGLSDWYSEGGPVSLLAAERKLELNMKNPDCQVLWQKIGQLPGGDKDPFTEQVQPVYMGLPTCRRVCLSCKATAWILWGLTVAAAGIFLASVIAAFLMGA